jgi:putative PIN family toxin of toxin-antitoxin system
VRAVLDPNVLISALGSPSGTPAALVRAWLDGVYDVVLSPKSLAELQRALAYPHLAELVSGDDAQELTELLRRAATVADDQDGTPGLPAWRDPGDDYLIALAAAADAMLVSGDRDLLSLGEDLPIHSPAEFLVRLRDL